MSSKEVTDSTIFESQDYEINEERLNSFVKATEVVKEELEDNNSEAQNKENSESSLRSEISEMTPDYMKFNSKARIIDIKFDLMFENFISNNSITEIDKIDKTPNYLEVKFNTEDTTWSKRFYFSSEQTHDTKRFIEAYGDGRIDDLIGTEVNIKPNYNSSEEKYQVITPSQKLTSILKCKYEKYRSKIAKRPVDKKDTYTKYLGSNLTQFGFTSITVISFIFMLYLNYHHIVYLNPDISEILLIILGSSLLWALIALVMGFMSILVSQRGNIIGDIEVMLVLTGIQLKNNLISKLNSINSSAGKIVS